MLNTGLNQFPYLSTYPYHVTLQTSTKHEKSILWVLAMQLASLLYLQMATRCVRTWEI